MERDVSAPVAPTRREYLTYGGAVVGGGFLAGCAGEADDAGTTPDGTEPTTSEATGSTTTETDAYTVSMAPMGEVAFESVPDTIFTRLTHHAGMAFALGRGNDVNAMHAPDYYDALWNQFTPRLPGVSLDWSGLYSSWEPSREKLYALDSDVHLADPASVFALESWDMADVEVVAEDVSPWFGNQFSDTHQSPPPEWADRYEYYDLWDMFERVARVFRESGRYEVLAAVHDDLLATIEADLPPADRRPTVAMLGLSDAFGDDVAATDTVDLEGVLEADPDVVLALGGMHPGTDVTRIRADLASHPVGRELAAVRNDRVYAQGARYQGPILNLFQLEMTAKQLYPDAFGEWPTYEAGPYPELPREEQLFDREEVADIVTGGGTNSR